MGFSAREVVAIGVLRCALDCGISSLSLFDDSGNVCFAHACLLAGT